MKPIYRIAPILLFLSLLFFGQSDSFGQERVYNTPILNVDVSLQSADGGIFHTKTNFGGNFRFSNIPAGVYTLTFSEPSLSTFFRGQKQGFSTAFTRLDYLNGLTYKLNGKTPNRSTTPPSLEIYPRSAAIRKITVERTSLGPVNGNIYASGPRSN